MRYAGVNRTRDQHHARSQCAHERSTTAMDEEVEEPLEELTASDEADSDDDLGDGARTYTCNAGCSTPIRK